MSKYKLDGHVEISTESDSEIGDDASSRVYCGYLKQVSLKPLIEHLYLEDKRQVILQVASKANITISYHTKKRERKKGGSRFKKPPEKMFVFVCSTN